MLFFLLKLLSSKSNNHVENASIYSRDEEGCTALHLAARFGRAEILKILLAAGSLVNGCNQDGATSLHVACQRNHPEIVSLLLACPSKLFLFFFFFYSLFVKSKNQRKKLTKQTQPSTSTWRM